MKKTVKVQYAEVEVSDIYISKEITISDFVKMVQDACYDTIQQLSFVRQKNPDVDMFFADGEIHSLLNFIEKEVHINRYPQSITIN